MRRISLGLVLATAMLLAAAVTAESLELQELAAIRQAIEEQGADWFAGPTSVSKLSKDQFRSMLGVHMVPGGFETRPGDVIIHGESKDYPGYFNWRFNMGGDWTTPIRDQAQCGSCAAFGTMAAFEALLNIYNNDPNLDLDLSEEHLFMCSGGGCTTGSTLQSPAMYVANSGVPDEACFPYTATDQPCSNTCPDWQSRAHKAGSWKQLGGNVETLKAEVMAAPVVTSFMVYEDFRYYVGGVYEHVYGTYQGGHAVCIVGWNDSENSWIVKNSWGTDWGEQGWFRIRRGNSQIGMNSVALSMEPGGCAAEELALNTPYWNTLEALRTFRDQVMRTQTFGDQWISLYEAYSSELVAIVDKNPELKQPVLEGIALASRIAQRGLKQQRLSMTKSEQQRLIALSESLKPHASMTFKTVLDATQNFIKSTNGLSLAVLFN